MKTNKLCDLNWIKTKKHPSIEKNKGEISIIDLFSGCGGMTLGATEAIRTQGYNPVINFAIDLYPEAIEVYKNNFSSLLFEKGQIINGDINNYTPGNIGEPFSETEKELQNLYANTDIIMAGPPCQGHSNLNNHTRRNDPRNNLYFKVIRFVEIIRPKVVIIENVSSVLLDKNQVVQKSAKYLEDLGYFVNKDPLIINMSEYGLAQKRKRHIQIATRNNVLDDIDLSIYKMDTKVLWDYINDLENISKKEGRLFDTPSQGTPINLKRMDYLFQNDVFDLPDELRPPCHQLKKHSYNACYGRLRKELPAPTITSGFGSMGQGRYVHPTQKRVITPHEAARIQGFPDYFSFDSIKNRGIMQTIIANAVPPRIMAIFIEQFILSKTFNR